MAKTFSFLSLGGIPKSYVENSGSKGVIELSIIEQIKKIVEENFEAIRSTENEENARGRL